MDQQRSTNSQMESRILGRLKTTAMANNQSIDGTSCYEATQPCKNCPLSRKEHGRALFEQDMAQRNPEDTNFRRGDDLQQQGNGVKGPASVDDQNERNLSVSSRQEPCLRNSNTVSKQAFLNGYTSHKSGGDEGRLDDSDKSDEEDDITYKKKCSSNAVPTSGGYGSCYGNTSDGSNDDDDDNDDDEDDDDDDDDNDGDYHEDDDHGDNNHYDYNGDNYDNSRYDNGNNVHDNGDGHNDNDDDDNDNDNDDSNGKEHYNNINKGDNYGKESHDSLTTEHLACKSEKDSKYSAEESSLSLPFSKTSNGEINITENTLGRPDNSTDDEKLPSMGGKTFETNNSNNQNTYLGSNVTNLNQGAKPRTTSQRVPKNNVADRPNYCYSRIPSLEVTGINEGFLARHTTDTSLPNASNSNDFNLSAESASFAQRRHASPRSKNNSDMLWSLPPPPEGMLRWQRPYANELQYGDVGHQVTTPMMSLRSDWQLSHQPQSERNASYIPRPEQWLLNHTDLLTANQQQSLAHGSLQRHFPGATGTQDGNSLNRHDWMSTSYDSNWHYLRTDLHSSGINTSRFPWNEPVMTLPAVKSLAPAVVPPSVTLPETRPQSASSSVALNGFSSNNFSGLNGNGQEWLEHSTRLKQNVSQNQENRRLTSSEMVSSRREELRSSNSEASLAPGTPQQSSLASNATDDYTLAALERKVAEACAIVERVKKERDQRIKAMREAAQREREIRERNEREARERREREARERNEREDRERVERERREREARERERVERERREREARERERLERERREREAREAREREIREREAREARERRRNEEQEGEERERRVARERSPVQESLRWQCQHYQRRCKVSFPCCGVFYPCHRCHNESGACDAADMKANQATHVKCSNCGHEEEINETSQHCSSCGSRMSEYFCFKCKHFTGVEKNPFHCNKCGICRIFKDKSFHCDVCNVCLDKRLEGKHKCRPDSGHDECCICLEDAFSGCQILPCSHKVHKECAIAMIQNGVRNCPICRHPLFNQPGSQ